MAVTSLHETKGDNWHLWNGDCVDVAKSLPDACVGYSIHSPPFSSLYTFSDDPRDMSNCRTNDEFWGHYDFIIKELFRVTKPGRLASIHCMNLPTSKQRDGYIGIYDFRGDVIRHYQAAGFIYHAECQRPTEVTIRKDPVSAMQRSKAIGLLHKQLVKDSCMSRMAIADYVIHMRKPGDNVEPVSGVLDRYYGTEAPPEGPLEFSHYERGRIRVFPGSTEFSIGVWQRYAETVWLDVPQSDVLSRDGAREHDDERHIAPLQLTVIRRCLDLWSNPGDVVFSPFAGIGSEGYVALEMGRKFIGAELKRSYYDQAVGYLTEASKKNPSLIEIMQRGVA